VIVLGRRNWWLLGIRGKLRNNRMLAIGRKGRLDRFSHICRVLLLFGRGEVMKRKECLELGCLNPRVDKDSEMELA
jgi:hypothetical protein